MLRIICVKIFIFIKNYLKFVKKNLTAPSHILKPRIILKQINKLPSLLSTLTTWSDEKGKDLQVVSTDPVQDLGCSDRASQGKEQIMSVQGSFWLVSHLLKPYSLAKAALVLELFSRKENGSQQGSAACPRGQEGTLCLTHQKPRAFSQCISYPIHCFSVQGVTLNH